MNWLVKVIVSLTFIASSNLISAKNYYVAPTGGNDLNPGSLNQPWATWQKGFNTAIAGDTVFFRGGVWYLGTNDYVIHNPLGGHGHNGTYGNEIVFINYPGEVPILDAIGHTNKIDATAFEITNTTYVKFIGLTVRNQRQQSGVSDQWIASMEFYDNGNLYLDQITCHSGGGYGIWFNGYDTLYLLNCDSYDHCDTLRADGELGNRSDGFQISSGSDVGDYTYIYGCRAWNNSDDGMEISTGREYYASNCWMFNNGRFSHGAGTGFKYGPAVERTFGKRVTSNCLAAFNRGNGFSDQNLLYEDVGPINHFFNNTAYRCNFGFDSDKGEFSCSTGYTEEIFRNNLAYESTYGVVGDNYPSYYTVYLTLCAEQSNHAVQDHNSWIYSPESPFWEDNPLVNVTDADFVLIDSTVGVNQLKGPRKADGSLPNITFLKLAEDSDLIDKGIDVGLSFYGNAPDLGYSEYKSGSMPTSDPVYLNSVIENSSPSKLEMTYNLTLANVSPATSAFTVKVNSTARNISSVTISGTKVILNLASPVIYGDVVTLTYTKPSVNPLQTPTGGQAASLTAQNVTNNVAQAIPVYVSSVIENASPSKLEMTYNLTLANVTPATSAFTVKVNSTARSISSVTISGTQVILNLASPVLYGDVVTVAYAKPSANPLQTLAGGQAASITTQSVINNCSQVPNQPPVISIASPIKNTSFTAPATITVDAFATDPDGTIRNVEFFNGNSKLGECTTLPYSLVWKNVSEGTYTLTAVATDNLNSRSTSSPVSVTVEKSANTINQLPEVNLKYPNNGRKFKKNEKIIIEAVASDPDGEVVKVEFKNGTTTIAESLTAPYIYVMENADTGKYVITAVAIDNLGAISTSSETEFIVFDPFFRNIDIARLYPNPNDGHFTLDLSDYESEDTPDRIRIINLAGEVMIYDVLTDQQDFRDFNLTNILSGAYIIMLTREDRIISTGKFVIK